MKRGSRTSSTKLDIQVTITSRFWTRKLRTATACAKRAATAAVKNAISDVTLPSSSRDTIEIGILLATDHALRQLNRDYRGIDKPTNVLSFPAFSPDDVQISDAPILLGDVAVAYGVSNKEARASGISMAAHLSHLVAHGALHLLGYDHQSDHDALKMEELEIKILADLGITNPYIEAPREVAPAQKRRAQFRKNITPTRAKK